MPKRLLTLHHLRPKSRGGGPEVRVPTCKPCHKQIHATFTNKQLAADFANIDALRTAEQLQPFLKFIRKQKPDRNITVKTVRRRRR
ncbi:MAG: HNH endonuclease signature motif containing protein [Planctomycetota bacterium]